MRLRLHPGLPLVRWFVRLEHGRFDLRRIMLALRGATAERNSYLQRRVVRLHLQRGVSPLRRRLRTERGDLELRVFVQRVLDPGQRLGLLRWHQLWHLVQRGLSRMRLLVRERQLYW